MEAISFFNFPFPFRFGISEVVSMVKKMNKLDTPRWHNAHRQSMRRNDLSKMLEILLTFDRNVVESSMRLYKVPRRDRIAMRAQNRRLHHALRECLPRLLERNARFLRKAGRKELA